MRLDLGIRLLEFADELLGLLALGFCLFVRAAGGAGVGEAAGALDEMQVVRVAPGLDVVFPDEVHRANELHAGEIGTVELRHHRLNLRAPEHTHEDRLDHIVIVVPEGNFVAAELLCKVIKIAAPHARAEIAGGLFYIVNGAKDIGLENLRRDAEFPQIILNDLPVRGAVARVHDEEPDLERKFIVKLQLLK